MIPNTSVFDITKIAAAAHELNRLFCAATGDHSQVHWEDTSDGIKQSAIDGVQAIIDGRITKPSDSHDNWMKFKLENGWKFGPTKSEALKTHPCLVPFEELPKEQQLKDHIFFGLVRSLLEFNEHVLEPPTAESPAEEPGPGEEFIAKQSLKLIGFLYQHYDEEFQGELGFGDIAINVITKLRGKLEDSIFCHCGKDVSADTPNPPQTAESCPAEGLSAYDLGKHVMTVAEAKAHFDKEAGEAAEAYTEMKKVEEIQAATEAMKDEIAAATGVTGMVMGAPEVGGHDTIETPADVPQYQPVAYGSSSDNLAPHVLTEEEQKYPSLNATGVPVNVADGE